MKRTEQSGCIENCIYCVNVKCIFQCNVQDQTDSHIECIGLYTQLIRWHCLGAESYQINEKHGLDDLNAMAWRVMYYMNMEQE